MVWTKSSVSTPLGQMTMVVDDECLLGLYFDGQKYDQRGFAPQQLIAGETAVTHQVRQWLEAYFSGVVVVDRLPFQLCPQGTAFQKQVWQALLKIPYGQTVTYGELAKTLDCRSAQAIGGAVGKNPISLIIPCHRVLGADGSLTGYAGGIERKQQLLEWEKAHAVL